MTDRSSLDVLLDTNQTERLAYLSHFESLDTKAGLALGFAGVLIVVGDGSQSAFGMLSLVGSALAAIVAVVAFWPREFPTIDPGRLGDYAMSDVRFTQLTLLDTFELMLVETQAVLMRKSRRLKVALVSLTASAVLAAVDLIQR